MMMRRLPDIAMRECFGELRAACRLPIDQTALDVLMERLRPNFERILGHPDGREALGRSRAAHARQRPARRRARRLLRQP